MPRSMPEIPGRSCALLLFVSALLTTQLTTQLAAQSALRAWGYTRFDTDAYTVPAKRLAADGSATALLRVDDRILFHGSTILPDVPPPAPGLSYDDVGVMWNNVFALRSDGVIVSWGSSGSPGLPTPTLPAGVTYTAMSIGYDHVVALRSDGTAVAWGSSASGQTALPMPPAGVTVQKVHAGHGWSALHLSNGSIMAVGQTSYIGVPALPPGTTYRQMWAGPFDGVALRSDGIHVSWGRAFGGQGNVPVPPAGVTYTTMAIGQSHSIAARSDGVLVGWGDDTTGAATPPTTLPAGNVTQLAADRDYSLALFDTGEVIGWGRAGLGLPVPALATGERWVGMAAGFPILGLRSSGAVTTFADDPNFPAAQPPLPPGTEWVELTAGTDHVIGLRSDGRAFAWGSNRAGQCAIPSLPTGMTYILARGTDQRTALVRSDGFVVECGLAGARSIPPPPVGTRYLDVGVHRLGTILLRSDGIVEVIGGTHVAQTQIPTLPRGVAFVRVGMCQSWCAALRTDGQVTTWGSSSAPTIPTLPAGISYIQLEADDDRLVLRRSDGRIDAFTSRTDPQFLATPTPQPGESFVDVSVTRSLGVGRIGSTSTYTTFASGCAGTLPAARIVPSDTPRIEEQLRLHVFDLPQNVALLAFSMSRNAPAPLASLGMPGCDRHVTADATVLLAGRDAHASIQFSIPSSIGLVGVNFYNQAVVLDPGANAAGAVVSDAAEGVIGR